jgi:WD40 repeat protein
MSDSNGRIYRADLERGEINQLVENIFQPILSAPLDVSSQNNLVLVGSRGFAYLLDVESGEPIQYFLGHKTGVSAVALAPDEQLAFTASLDGELFVWNVATGEKVKELIGHQTFVTSMDLAADGESLISSSSDGNIYLWDIDSGDVEMRFVVEPIAGLEGQYEARASELEVSFSPDGRLMAISTPDQQLQLYDRQTGQLRHVWPNVGGGVIVWIPDGTHLASSTAAAEVNLWQIPSQQHPLRLSQHPDAINSLVFSSQGDMLLSTSQGEARRWDTESGKLLQHIISFGTGLQFIAAVFDKPEQQMLAIDGLGRIHQWDMETSQDDLGLACLNTCSPSRSRTNMGFSRNGRFALVRISTLALAEVLDIVTGSRRAFGSPTPNPDLEQASDGAPAFLTISGARVSPNGRWATYIDTQDVNSVQLWDADNAQMVHALAGHTSRITAIDFSDDNQFLLTASADGMARIWAIASGEALQRFVVPNVQILAAVFSEDGRFVLTGDTDGLARLWNVATGEQIRVFGGQHEGGVTAVAFSADGQRVATGDGAGDIRIWDVNLDNTIQLACAQLPRDFTDIERQLYNIPDNTTTCLP